MPISRTVQGLPRARPMHVTSGTTGTPKGVYSGLLDDEQAAALVAEERDLWGFAARRRQPGAQPALPLSAAPVRDGNGARRRAGGDPGAVRPGRGHGGDQDRAADVDVLRADPPAAALRALGRGGGARPVLLPAGGARRRAVPARDQAAADRGVPGRQHLGVLRVDRGPVHRLPRARSGWRGRAPSGGPGRGARSPWTRTA